jgi:tetratricopeptide (TPR) repeat protein
MRRGEFERAYRLLRPLADAAGDNVPAPLRCELALAATGARQHTTALRLAQALERAGARCPFLPPLDQLGVPILLAWNRARVGSDASAGLADLDRLRSHSAGAGLSLIDAAVRDIALQAARRSYESGAARSARSYLAVAARHGNSDPRVRHNLAVLEVESGNVDAAIAVFEAVSAVVPEALVNLGVAYERKDQPTLALSYYRRALAAGVRFEPLEQWIERKRRLWAERGGDD